MIIEPQEWPDGSHPFKWLIVDAGFSSARVVLHKNSKVPVMKDFQVRDPLRGYRVGTKFLKGIEEYFKKRYNAICVQTGKNDSFYIKRGYQVLDENYLIKKL